MNQNIYWVDHLKWIGILAVILGHMNSPMSQFVFTWHMPLFFMISGFFIKTTISPQECIKKDFRRLMIPYFIFSLLGLAIEMVKRIALHREQIPLLEGLKGIFIDMNYQSLQIHYGFVLWFLPTLFLARLIVFLLVRRFAKIWTFIIVVFLFVFSFLLKLPFAIDHAMNAALWVFLGNMLFPLVRKNISAKTGIMLLTLTIAWGMLFGFPSLNMADQYYQITSLNIIAALLIIGTIVFLVQKIKSGLTHKWANETLLLMVFHPYTNNVAYLIVEKISADLWMLKLLLSLFFLQVLVFIKSKSNGGGIFKYV